MGESQHAKTLTLKMGIAGAIPLKRGAIGVMAEAVSLDYHASVTEEGDVHRPRVRLEHSPDCRGALRADDRSPPKCEQCRHAPAFEAESRMADRVNPAMKTVQASTLRSLRDALIAEPRIA